MEIYTGVVGFGFALFGYLAQASLIERLVGHRWLLFATFLLIFPATSAFYSFARRRSPVIKVLLVAGVALYVLLGIGSTTTNRDRPLYGEDFTSLLELTYSEQAGLLYLRGLHDEDLNVDFWLCFDLKGYFPADKLNCWEEVDLARVQGRFTFRDAYLRRPLLIGQSLTDKDLSFMGEEGVMLLYDSGGLKLFERDSAPKDISE